MAIFANQNSEIMRIMIEHTFIGLSCQHIQQFSEGCYASCLSSMFSEYTVEWNVFSASVRIRTCPGSNNFQDFSFCFLNTRFVFIGCVTLRVWRGSCLAHTAQLFYVWYNEKDNSSRKFVTHIKSKHQNARKRHQTQSTLGEFKTAKYRPSNREHCKL